MTKGVVPLNIELSWQAVITAAAVAGAVVALVTYFVKLVHWVDKQKKQDSDIAALKTEQTLIVYGLLACLKGLKEQGCNGPVTEAINKIEKHLNKEAHRL